MPLDEFESLLCESVDPVVQLITECFDIFNAVIFGPENGFIRNIEVKQSFLCELIAFQLLALLYEKLSDVLS